MSNNKLLSLIKERCYKQGNVTLSSGMTSNYYIDLRMIELYSEALPLIGRAFHQIIYPLMYHNPLLGGLGFGSVPLVVSTLLTFHQQTIILEGFFIREIIKDYALSRSIEGNFQPNSNVILLEDVCTTGQSILKAAHIVETLNCRVIAIVTLLDRLEGASQNLSQYNYQSIFTINDLR